MTEYRIHRIELNELESRISWIRLLTECHIHNHHIWLSVKANKHFLQVKLNEKNRHDMLTFVHLLKTNAQMHSHCATVNAKKRNNKYIVEMNIFIGFSRSINMRSFLCFKCFICLVPATMVFSFRPFSISIPSFANIIWIMHARASTNIFLFQVYRLFCASHWGFDFKFFFCVFVFVSRIRIGCVCPFTIIFCLFAIPLSEMLCLRNKLNVFLFQNWMIARMPVCLLHCVYSEFVFDLISREVDSWEVYQFVVIKL